MQGVEIKGIDGLLETIDAFLSEVPERRRTLHARIGVRLKEEVDAEIGLAIKDENGHVRAWQEPSVGTGGGYAAVRPQKGETGADSPGAITNYLENGHRIRQSEKRARAFGFYETARKSAKAILLEEAERFASEMREALS